MNNDDEKYRENVVYSLKSILKKLYSQHDFAFSNYRSAKEYELLSKLIKQHTGKEISKYSIANFFSGESGNFKAKNRKAIDEFIEKANNLYAFADRQIVLWGPDYGFPAGIFINNVKGQFIEWGKLKEEIESQILQGCPRLIPPGCKVEVRSFYGKENHIVKIIGAPENNLSVWLGGDPEKGFYKDGLVRIGKTISDTEWVVYQIYQRYSDNTYRLIKSNV